MAMVAEVSSPQRAGMTVHEADRAKKSVENNVKAIENRISFFKREEERIWRDLEEVRRQAATIEEGRNRTLEKKLADRAIQQEKDLLVQQNRTRAAANKIASLEQKRRAQFATMREKQMAGQDQRRASQDIMRQKKTQDAQARLQNSERAVAVQRTQLEARLKANQEKAERLERMREAQEAERLAAEGEVQEVESRLPQLEAEELACLQRLQNSRIVTQTVLQELEASLGAASPAAALLRQRQRGQEHLDTSVSPSRRNSVREEFEEEEEVDDLGTTKGRAPSSAASSDGAALAALAEQPVVCSQ